MLNVFFNCFPIIIICVFALFKKIKQTFSHIYHGGALYTLSAQEGSGLQEKPLQSDKVKKRLPFLDSKCLSSICKPTWWHHLFLMSFHVRYHTSRVSVKSLVKILLWTGTIQVKWIKLNWVWEFLFFLRLFVFKDFYWFSDAFVNKVILCPYLHLRPSLPCMQLIYRTRHHDYLLTSPEITPSSLL